MATPAVEDGEDIAAGALARDGCGEVGPLLEADAAHVAGTHPVDDDGLQLADTEVLWERR